MKFSRQVFGVLLSLIVGGIFCAGALAAEASAPAATSSAADGRGRPSLRQTSDASTSVLPTEFAGWQVKGTVTQGDDPAAADAANAPVLKEYGFVRLEKAAYTRDDGRNLTVKAAVFEDASGAYGAFTYYVSDEMRAETIGGAGAYLNNRVLFYQGNVLVDAVFGRMSVMSAAQ